MEDKQQQEIANKNDERDLDLMEIEVFRQYWKSLNTALADIKALRGADAPDIDPVEYVKTEVSNLKNQFAELKDLIEKQTATQREQTQQSALQRGYAPQPMVPPVVMPYYQTPSYAPYVPVNN